MITITKPSLHYAPLLHSPIILACAALLAGMAGSAATVANEPLLDPTRPLAYSSGESEEKSAPTLQAIFLRDSGHQAVIDGRIVDIGDAIGGMRVQSIGRNKVRLVNGEAVRELQLRPSILSTPESEG